MLKVYNEAMERLNEENIVNKGVLTDEELILESRTNPKIYSQIIDRYGEAFLRKAKSIMKDEEAARDVVQETFTKIYLKSTQFASRGDGSFKSWGYKVLVNTAYTHYQKLHRGSPVELSEELEAVLPDLGELNFRENKELVDYVSSILTRIPDHFAGILGKFFLEGKSQEEIAKEEGLSVGAVKTRVYRAKEAFRDAMKTIA